MALLEELFIIGQTQTKLTDKIIQESITGPWMNQLFGFTDHGADSIIPPNLNNTDLLKHLDKFFIKRLRYNPEEGLLMIDGKTPSLYQTGWFIAPTVADIKHLLNKIVKKGGVQNIGVIKGLDVGKAHVDASPLEIFQCASQMNALEMIDPNKRPEDGIEIYTNDGTQGPRCALACAPGTFVRNYFHNIFNESQFNALENLNLTHHNGYLIWGDRPEMVEPKILVDLIKIPCMIYTQVAGVTIANGMITKHIQPKLVHQIYSSAVPVNVYGNKGSSKIQMEIARRIIAAEYIGAIGMGLILHTIDKAFGRTNLPRARINLTLIGAGVFNVPEHTVLELIRQVINSFHDYSFDLLIHGYSGSTAKTITEMLDIPIVPANHIFPEKNPKDFLLIIPRKNDLIEVYPLRDYQEKILMEIWANPYRNYQFDGSSLNININAEIFSMKEKGVVDRGFIGSDLDKRFFVSRADPRIQAIKIEDHCPIQLYDWDNKIIKTWPIYRSGFGGSF